MSHLFVIHLQHSVMKRSTHWIQNGVASDFQAGFCAWFLDVDVSEFTLKEDDFVLERFGAACG